MDFIDLYQDFATEQTDAPPQFQRALAYFILSSIVNKKAHFPFGHMKLYPNLYLLIGAPSSVHRKSWSLAMAIKMIRNIYDDILIPDCSSRESFIAEFADPERQPSEVGLIRIDELKGFMARARNNQHFQGFIQDLSSLYTSDKFKRRKGVSKKEMESFTLHEPFLNIGAACSLDWLSEAVTNEDITGGFLARFLWVVTDHQNNEPQDLPNEPNLDKNSQLIAKLQRIADFIGEGRFNPEARQLYRDWYAKTMRAHQGSKFDANYNRLTVTALKISLLNALSRAENDDKDMGTIKTLVIEKGDIARAILWIEDTTNSFKKVIIGSTPNEVMQNRVYKYIKDRHAVKRSQVLNGVRSLTAKWLDGIIRTLQESELIEIEVSKNGSDKPCLIYRIFGE